MARMTIRDLGWLHARPTSCRAEEFDSRRERLESRDMNVKWVVNIKIGVRVGQVAVGTDDSDFLKGVTVILPCHPDEVSIPCYAGMHTLNGNGEVSRSYQIKDWGSTNTVCLRFLLLFFRSL